MEQYEKLKEEFNTSSFLIDLIEEYKKHCKIFLNIFNEGIINKYLYKKALYFYSFCLKHKKYFFNKNYVDEDLYKNILKINYDFKYLMDIRHSIVYLYYYYKMFTSRQIFALIFEKEHYPCQRFEVGNNINKEVYITQTDKFLKEFLVSCKEDKSHTLYDYLNNYSPPRIIEHGKYYDEISMYSFKEDKDNRHNLTLEEVTNELIKVTHKYLDDNYNVINISEIFKKIYRLKV